MPDSINRMIESFKMLPGVGEKTAERLAFSILDFDDEQIELFSKSIIDVNTKVKKCSCCNTLTENDICSICSDPTRNDKILCVVDDVKSVFLFEKMGMFDGYYHVLDGLISPMDGINPEDIGLEKLLERIRNNSFNEIVFAFNPSIEAETTSMYIKRILSDSNIVFTRLASGVPMGANMEYIDSLTLQRALSDRKEIE
ncbi:MAG: recombination protein RecR [Bacilli bacterium]|nr:recombination protein RecR [Bacilli bacterium]